MGHCHGKMHPSSTRRTQSRRSIWLLKTHQKVTAGMNKTINTYYSLFHALKEFYSIRQHAHESVEAYFRHFEAVQDLIVLSNGTITDLSRIVSTKQKADNTVIDKMVVQKFLAVVFIEQADCTRYQALQRELKNNLTMKQDTYPISLAESVHMLTHWKGGMSYQRTHPLVTLAITGMEGHHGFFPTRIRQCRKCCTYSHS